MIVAQCEANGTKWEDPDFPATASSLVRSLQQPENPDW
jgi:hypothetical protein